MIGFAGAGFKEPGSEIGRRDFPLPQALLQATRRTLLNRVVYLDQPKLDSIQIFVKPAAEKSLRW